LTFSISSLSCLNKYIVTSRLERASYNKKPEVSFFLTFFLYSHFQLINLGKVRLEILCKFLALSMSYLKIICFQLEIYIYIWVFIYTHIYTHIYIIYNIICICVYICNHHKIPSTLASSVLLFILEAQR
jgi:hypothetical protein